MNDEQPHEPIYLRPSPRPLLVRVLVTLLLPAVALVLAGAPVWFFMHGDAQGWQSNVRVTVRVEPDARCRTGPPPGNPTTCDATWETGNGRVVEGQVSDRYGGSDIPTGGGTIEARIVDDELAMTGFQVVLLHWALVSPYLTGAGVGLAGLLVLGLIRFDPRWQRARTDLPDA
ncbi:MAG: hypothetical protein WB767_10235 [Nocardioides sp.]